MTSIVSAGARATADAPAGTGGREWPTQRGAAGKTANGAAGGADLGRAFFIVTLGCKVNQYEAQALREAWTGAGLAECGAPGEADEIIIHSCAVTANAVADTRAMVRRMRRAAPQAAIRVMGCAAEVCAEKLATLPGVEFVIVSENVHEPETVSLAAKRARIVPSAISDSGIVADAVNADVPDPFT